MPRQPRKPSPTGWYHLINRGADKQDTFSHDADYAHFERLVGDVSARTNVEIHAYCLMTNHFHLVAKGDDGDVSALMRDVTGAYSLGYNHRNDRRGPLFGGRFHAIPVESDRQLAALGRYVHRNPLSFVPLATLAAYRWSSLGVYVGRRSDPGWLTMGVLDARSSMDCYREFVETALPHDKVDPTMWALPRRPSLDDLESVTASRAVVDRSALVAPNRNQPRAARTMVVMLAVELRLAGADELADRFGLSSANAVRTLARRGRVQVANDESFGRLRRRVLDGLADDPFADPFGA